MVRTSAPSAASSGVRPSFSKICVTVWRNADSATNTWSFTGTLKRSSMVGFSSAAEGGHDLAGESRELLDHDIPRRPDGPGHHDVVQPRISPLHLLRLRTPSSRVAVVGDWGCRATTARACSSL